MRTSADVIIAFKEYPHTDALARMRELYDIVRETAQGRVKPSTAVYDCKMVGKWHTTREPMSGFVRRMQAVEQQPGVLSVSLGPASPGPTCRSPAPSWRAGGAGRLGRQRRRRRAQRQHFHPARAAARGLDDIAIGGFWDLGAVQLCADAGVGARVELRLGGKGGPMSGDPIDLSVTVMAVVEDHTQPGLMGDDFMGLGRSVWGPYGQGHRYRADQQAQPGAGDRALHRTRHHADRQEADRREVGPALPRPLRAAGDGGALRLHAGAVNVDFARLPYRVRSLDYWPRVADPHWVAPAVKPPGQLYEIDGLRLHLHLSGPAPTDARQPTVVIESGAGTVSPLYARLQRTLARKYQVCSYDRPGLGWSQPDGLPLDAERNSRRLHALLEAAGVRGPVVFIGHSLGGLLTPRLCRALSRAGGRTDDAGRQPPGPVRALQRGAGRADGGRASQARQAPQRRSAAAGVRDDRRGVRRHARGRRADEIDLHTRSDRRDARRGAGPAAGGASSRRLSGSGGASSGRAVGAQAAGVDRCRGTRCGLPALARLPGGACGSVDARPRARARRRRSHGHRGAAALRRPGRRGNRRLDGAAGRRSLTSTWPICMS
ncbi:metallopeptidase family m81 domain-containing protein [Ditylenchus destructor]|nr:metallopeptidase family m81 domain-containing protein [Ditylenchus destructor]